MKFHHIGIPTNEVKEGEIYLPHLKMHVTEHDSNPYGIQWMRFDDDAPYPRVVKTMPHVAFIVPNLLSALAGKEVIIPPNSPSKGLTVAFILEQGAPVELMEYDDTEEKRPMGIYMKETVEA